jgi:hypothetical protein
MTRSIGRIGSPACQIPGCCPTLGVLVEIVANGRWVTAPDIGGHCFVGRVTIVLLLEMGSNRVEEGIDGTVVLGWHW